jgi:outer membrane receptor protein involved in Fe transport
VHSPTPRPARLRTVLALVLALAPVAAPLGEARAEGVADEAELHFQIAAERYQKGDFLGALEHFFASNRLVPNRNVVFNIARTYEQLKRYADAHRYYTEALEAEDRPDTQKQIQAAIGRIAPNVAVLRVESTPPGATVYIDRKDLGSRGKAPRALALPEGKYRVIAELDGYELATSDAVEVRLGREVVVPVALRRIVGVVEVGVSGAKSAEVRVDDEAAPVACTAPCKLELAPGRHTLLFSREGFQAPPRQINVVAKETLQTTAALAPLTGSLALSADEGNAVVEIDGKLMGSTPAAASTPTVLQNVPVGRRHVRVTLRGYAPLERDIDVKNGQQAELLDLKLEPLHRVSAVSRYAEDVDDAPSSVTIIDGQELRAFGYPTIAEALRGVRGVYLSNDRAYQSAGLRGLGQPNDYGNRLLVLSDGASLNDNILSSSYIGSDGRADLHDLDRIEVVRGPGSLLYGTGAFAGVVNLVPKGKDDPSQIHVGVGTYDNAVGRARGGFQYNFSPNVGVWASASGARSDGVDLPVTVLAPAAGQPATQTVSSVDAFRSGGTAGRFWAGPFTAQWFLHSRAQKIPVGVAQSVLGDTRTVNTDTRWLVELRYEPKLSEHVQLFLRAHANRYTFEGVYANPLSETQPFADASSLSTERYVGTWMGGEARLVLAPWKQLRVTAGGEGQGAPQADMKGSFPGQTPYVDTHNPYAFGAGYLVAEGSPTSWLRLSGGARVDYYTTFGAVLVPRGAIILKPAKGSVVKLMGGRAFRAPSVYEQYYNDGGTSQVPAVDESRGLKLSPESIVSGEIEYSQRFLEDWVALVAAHASRIDGFIETIADDRQPTAVRYANTKNPVLAVGGDVELRREWRQGWMVSAMYGYQRAQFYDFGDKSLPAIVGDPRLRNAPEHLASFKGVVPVLPELASLGLRTTLEAPRLDEQELATGTHVIADLTLSGSVKRFGVSYTVGAYNVTDARYAYPVSLAYLSRTMLQNGRTFLADLKVTWP